MRHSQDLETAREQILQADKMAALGELAASMAHDINNPAGIICSRLEIMEAEGAGRGMPERLQKDFSTLQNCAEYLRRVAENWTRFARESSLRMTDVDMNEAVRGTVDMVAESLSTHGIRLEVALHGSPIWVYGDRVRLQQVILNLINNARDAMQDGGVLRIQSQFEERNGSEPLAAVVVSDTGVGIPESDLARIFEPLFSSKTPERGTGLGLAISQKIVREMEGEIRVESHVGEGTVFRILLPVSESSKRIEHYGRKE
jgi:signal transduction histidine kinase